MTASKVMKIVAAIGAVLVGMFATLEAVDRTSPDSENVRKHAGPVASGVEYLPGGWLKVDLATGVANAFALTIQNPYENDHIITRAILDITDGTATAGALLDIDIVASSDATGDDIFDGVPLDAAALKDSLNSSDNGTNGEGKSWLWAKAGGANDWVTGKILIQNASGIAGQLYLQTMDAG